MDDAYRAVIRGNQVEWIDTPPHSDVPTEVAITLLRRSRNQKSPVAPGVSSR